MRFAAIGLDHRHIHHMVGELLAAGASCAGFCPITSDGRVLAGFRERFPFLAEADRRALLDDPSIDVLVTAAVPRDRAGLAVEAMRRGKDVMTDKPGVTRFADLAAVEAAVAETGRIFSICFSERFVVPSTIVAGKLIADGAIGRVVHTTGLGPHRLNRAIRPDWFFDTAASGGILADIASHQIDQFLHFTGSRDARIVASAVGNVGHPDLPGFEDFGDLVLQSDRARGFIRVDWFTPDGLPTWGDGRLVILRTEGTIDLRKYVDLDGRPGTDHLFLVDRAGTRHIDASREPRAADLLPKLRRGREGAHGDRDAAEPRLRGVPSRARSAGGRDPAGGASLVSGIGLAIVGLGPAALPHARSLLDLSDRAEVRWAASRSRERAAAFARNFPFPITTDIAGAIADPAVEAVLVLTPPAAHLEVAERCFEAGKHVLVEKPLELTVARGERLVAAGRRAGRRLGVTLQHRFRPASLRLRELVAGGALGAIEAASITVPWWRPQSYYDEPGRGTMARDGGGVLLTQAIHTLDLFRSLVGVSAVEAAQATTTGLHRMETEDYVSALLRLGNGAPGSILATTAFVPGRPERIEILARRGSASLVGGTLRTTWLDGGEEIVKAEGATGSGANIMDFPHDAHRALIGDVLDAIRENRDPVVSGEEALASQRLVDDILHRAACTRSTDRP